MPNTDLIFQAVLSIAQKKVFSKKTSLLVEGNTCKHIYFIEQGALRSWFNDEGKDITFQFYFEKDIVTSFESLQTHQPALYNIETITTVKAYVIRRDDFYRLVKNNDKINDLINEHLMHRLYHYQRLFISRIKNSPKQRYNELLDINPKILSRVPHHYIATYLGITPVSFSRIKNKKE